MKPFFFGIQQYLHASNNTSLPGNYKSGKVCHYFDELNKRFVTNFVRVGSFHVSIDETIVPYYGRHGTKQHIHDKPIRFGYKLWSAATCDGYLVTSEPYQGATCPALQHQPEYGLEATAM